MLQLDEPAARVAAGTDAVTTSVVSDGDESHCCSECREPSDGADVTSHLQILSLARGQKSRRSVVGTESFR